MIKVLQDWNEVGDACLSLERQRLPLHTLVQKNWDHALLLKALASVPRDAAIVDLGCGDALTLKVLRSAGYKQLYGVDLRISWRARLSQLVRMWRQVTLEPPYHLSRGSIVQTSFESERFDVALSVSTIEHGVDKAAFLQEAARILKPGGLLFVTTDYWYEKIDVPDSFRAYGQRWEIASEDEISQFLELALAAGFRLKCHGGVPGCGQKTVHWIGTDYTFIAVLLVKERQLPSEDRLN